MLILRVMNMRVLRCQIANGDVKIPYDWSHSELGGLAYERPFSEEWMDPAEYAEIARMIPQDQGFDVWIPKRLNLQHKEGPCPITEEASA